MPEVISSVQAHYGSEGLLDPLPREWSSSDQLICSDHLLWQTYQPRPLAKHHSLRRWSLEVYHAFRFLSLDSQDHCLAP
jgi:hypothetical protein